MGGGEINTPYQPVALCPVLETVKNKKGTHYISPQILKISDAFFPQIEMPSATALAEQYRNLQQVLSDNPNNLLSALHCHASSLAAGKYHNDLSLYDCIKVASAISHCLDNGNGKLRLAGGSISGIQTYLYDIISKRANKLLKGRSFYIQLLSDSLADALLESFGLSPCHIIYSSGGGFYIIMPDIENIEDRFQDFTTTITEKIYAQHGTNLNVEFALTNAFGQEKNIVDLWEELFIKLGEKKLQRLSDNPKMLKELLMGYVEKGGATIRDEITNEEIKCQKKNIASIGKGDDEIIVDKFTHGQIEKLGKKLREANYWISHNSDFNENAFKDPLGTWHLLSDSVPNKGIPSDAVVRLINKVDPQKEFVFYGGNRAPEFDDETIGFSDSPETRKGDPLTFDAMARGVELDRLGILRMDVDGLGNVFGKEIGPQPSFVRYAAVSRAMDWFFKGWINQVHQKYKKRTLIVYSGGDDLFIVGKWNMVLQMALDIRRDFEKWTCGNLTLSGGLSVVPPKFPVMQAAKLAGKAEEHAKEYRVTPDSEKEKDAFYLFGKSLSWKREMPIVRGMKDVLEELLGKNKLNIDRSLIGKINIHSAALEMQEKKEATPRWKWNLIYDLSRFEDQLRRRKKDNGKAADMVRKLMTDSFEDREYRNKNIKYHLLPLLQIAARWVELDQKTEGKTVQETN